MMSQSQTVPEPQYAPENLETTPWDVIVIGTGMGGSTVGYELARAGRRVLFLEKGKFLLDQKDRGDGSRLMAQNERPESRLKRGNWPLPLEGETSFGQTEFFAPLGSGTGGSANLFAAQMERMSPADFTPRAYHPGAKDSTLPDEWPVSYSDFTKYYRRAENLYRVRGTLDPLNPDKESILSEPPTLSERDQDLFDSFSACGLHPYRAHVACEFLPGCEECGGVLCPRECKNDAARICLIPALNEYGAKLLTECEVLQLEADEVSVNGIKCRQNGREFTLRGRIVVLAAGALFSPIILLKSTSTNWPNGLANRSGHVGRNLMWHASDFIAVRPRKARALIGPKKALALSDFYISNGVKLGTFQSVGVPVNQEYVFSFFRSRLQKAPKWQQAIVPPLFLKFIARAAAFYFRSTAVFAAITEDLPYFENRVYVDANAKNGMRFSYRYPEELRTRSVLFRRKIKAALRPRYRTIVLTGKNNLNFGHACGTCRFGNDPATSVLNPENRAHDVQNLYVCDASFFPSSGGTNPSLTIAANAIRVAEAIHSQLATG